MIVVTGHEGFIGRNLVDRLKKSDLVLVEKRDCFSFLSRFDLWKSIDRIYHMGAISDTTCTDLDAIHEYNVKFSLSLFEKAIENRIPVTYASSASVYGNSYDYSYNPLNHYAVSKVNVDIWVEANMSRFKNVVGMRFFNVYGRDENKGDQSSPLTKFSQQARETGMIRVFDVEAERDFVWVGDVVDCILTTSPSGIYDVGTGNAVSFMRVAEMVSEKYGAEIDVIPFPPRLKNKYQYYTRARKHFDREFMTVERFIDDRL